MELLELMGALDTQNKTERGFQIHLNSGNLEENSNKIIGIEFCDLHFNTCRTLRNSSLLCFDNSNSEPIGQREDGVDLYPIDMNNSLMIDISKIESIDEVEDVDDWYEIPSDRIINIYMRPENDTLTGNRNVVSIGFLGD